MIEKILLDFLNNVLTVPCYMEAPAGEKPAQYILIQKTGTAIVNHVARGTFAVQSYAPSLFEASLLNENVKDALLDSNVSDLIYGIHLNGDYNFTDTSKRGYRYQAVFNINYHEGV